MIEIFAPKAIPNRTAITTSAVAIQQIDYDVLYLLTQSKWTIWFTLLRAVDPYANLSVKENGVVWTRFNCNICKTMRPKCK